jgi:hypothetical protein
MSVVTSAGAYVPFTQTFVQGTITTTIPLVGQILNNGKTNFLGYDSGSAAYIVSSSAAGASATTLANGNTYYISSGKAPTGYTLLPGGSAATATGSVTATSSGQTVTTSTSVSSTGTGSAGNTGTTTSGGGSIAMTTASQTTTTSPTSNAAAAVLAGPATGVEGMMLGFLTMVLGLLI